MFAPFGKRKPLGRACRQMEGLRDLLGLIAVSPYGIARPAPLFLQAVRAKKPTKLIAARAVASQDALQEISKMADEVVCLAVPERFYSVGQFFREFNQVTDQEVIAILERNRSRHKKDQS